MRIGKLFLDIAESFSISKLEAKIENEVLENAAVNGAKAGFDLIEIYTDSDKDNKAQLKEFGKQKAPILVQSGVDVFQELVINDIENEKVKSGLELLTSKLSKVASIFSDDNSDNKAQLEELLINMSPEVLAFLQSL